MKSPNVVPRNKKGARKYGWVPDMPDHRDYLLGAVLPVPAKLPAKADLRPLCPGVENQGKLGSCTAHALSGALEVLEKIDRVPFEHFSRLFLYYNERAIEHTIPVDSGAMIRDGIKTLAKQGICPERSWPYIISKFIVKPRPTCYQLALHHKITSYRRILTINEMRTCLAAGFPFVFGFTVYESFESAEVAQTGIVKMPALHEKVVGGHAVLAVGYDDPEKVFLIRNSWGADWGMKGYFTLPYDYLASRNLSDDFWTIRRGEAILA